MTTDSLKTAKEVLEREISALNILKENLDSSFDKAVEMISQITGRVIVSGMGKSGHIGRKIAASLASTGTPAFFVHPGEASHGDLGMLTKSDLLLTISNSGEAKELCDIIGYSRRFHIPMIALTSQAESTMAKAADLVLLIPDKTKAPEACPFGMAPTTSTTLTLALGDALTVALMEKKGFSLDQYRDRHPGGKLGNILLKVSDIMAKGDDLPLVKPDMLMADVLPVMTSKSLGCVGIIDDSGKLLGVITDGDLRRHMDADLIVRRAKDIMTQSPKTISANLLASEAVHLMQNAKITNIFVLDENQKVIGVLHIHACLQAGVI